MIFALLVVVCCLGSVRAYTDDAKNDKVTSLPRSENLEIDNFGFSGYLDIDGSEPGSKHMHYWFFESANDPANDPVAFWTNGGPGCSGLLGGLSEQGPFWPQSDGMLATNQYAWNNNANMIFVEQPCGVGFSYSSANDTKADYTYNDMAAAKDYFSMIEKWLERFPEYAGNDLYLTSESYGGHYLPTLAKYIVDFGEGGNTALNGNFRGFMVGNPATDMYSTTPAMLDTWWGHQLLPKPLYDTWVGQCSTMVQKFANAELCEMTFLRMYTATSSLNPYALDFGTCVEDENYSKSSKSKSTGSKRTSKMRSSQAKRMLHHHLKSEGWLSEKVLETIKMGTIDPAAQPSYDACIDDYLTDFLNDPEVKAALHVNQKLVWSDCSYAVDYSIVDSELKNTAPIYSYLMENNDKYNLNILVYSGDDDSVCGTVGTQNWIYDLGFDVKKGYDWVEWFVYDQLAGYFVQFDGAGSKMAFATVHKAGHEVPTYQPAAALGLFQAYLNKNIYSDADINRGATDLTPTDDKK